MFQLHYFVNQPYLGYPHEAAAEFGAVMLKFSNRYFDGERAAALFERYHQEFQVAEQVGFDSILVNEHHNAPAAMSPSPNMSAAVLAKITSRAKIFIGGNILPVNGNPVRLAEELAMIDLFSKGRLICGFVRGGAVESLAMSVNTLHNREMFEEAHDLILKTWTQPGPFVWEGKHYQYRCVNPWALPMQKPHPPIMIPGSTSRETVEFAALRGYPYIALATRLEATDELFAAYDEIAGKAGHATTADRRGYFTRVHVAPTEEQAHEEGQALFGGRVAQVTSMVGMKIHPDAGAWMAPPDYVGQLPWSLKAGWGVGAMGSLGMLFIVNVFVLFFLVNHLGMPPGLAGIILFITRIYDVFSDPMIGYLSDRTRSRWGRRRPWMFLGAFMSGLALIFVFNVPTLASDNATAVYALIVLLAFFTGFTVFYVPFMAMPAEMTDDYNERTSIMSFRVGYSNAAGIVIAAGMPALINYLGGDRGAYEISAILAGILIALTMLMTVLFTGRARELPSSPKARYSTAEYFQAIAQNRPFLSLAALKFTVFLAAGINGSALLFFMTYVLERAELGVAFATLVGNIAGLLVLPLWIRISRGRDKRWVYLVAIIGSGLLFTSWALATPEESDLVFALRSFFIGAFGAGGLMMGFSMLPDTIEYDRIRTGQVRTGLYTGVLGFIEKTGFALGPLIMGFYFSATGLVESTQGAVEQPESAITAIIFGKAWIPAALQLMAIGLLMTYRLTEKRLAALRIEAAGNGGAVAVHG